MAFGGDRGRRRLQHQLYPTQPTSLCHPSENVGDPAYLMRVQPRENQNAQIAVKVLEAQLCLHDADGPRMARRRKFRLPSWLHHGIPEKGFEDLERRREAPVRPRRGVKRQALVNRPFRKTRRRPHREREVGDGRRGEKERNRKGKKGLTVKAEGWEWRNALPPQPRVWPPQRLWGTRHSPDIICGRQQPQATAAALTTSDNLNHVGLEC